MAVTPVHASGAAYEISPARAAYTGCPARAARSTPRCPGPQGRSGGENPLRTWGLGCNGHRQEASGTLDGPLSRLRQHTTIVTTFMSRSLTRGKRRTPSSGAIVDNLTGPAGGRVH